MLCTLLLHTLRRLVVRPSHHVVFVSTFFLSRGVAHPRTSSLGDSATPAISNVSLCLQRSLPLSSCCIICSVLSDFFFLFSRGDFLHSLLELRQKDPLVLPRPAFDVSLRQTLLDPRSPLNAEKLGACFVYLSAMGKLCGPHFRHLWRHA